MYIQECTYGYNHGWISKPASNRNIVLAQEYDYDMTHRSSTDSTWSAMANAGCIVSLSPKRGLGFLVFEPAAPSAQRQASATSLGWTQPVLVPLLVTSYRDNACLCHHVLLTMDVCVLTMDLCVRVFPRYLALFFT